MGGAGSDVFRFAEIDSGIDRITDLGTGERVEFTGILAGYTSGHASEFMAVRDSGGDLMLTLDPDGAVGAADRSLKAWLGKFQALSRNPARRSSRTTSHSR